MFQRLVFGALRGNPRRIGIIMFSTMLGSATAATLVVLALETEAKVGAELRKFGANIVVEPGQARSTSGVTEGEQYLARTDIGRALTIFWRNNVVGVAPILSLRADANTDAGEFTAPLIGAWYKHDYQRPGTEKTIPAGLLQMHPFWNVVGDYPVAGTEAAQVMVGSTLARRMDLKRGDSITLATGGEPRRFRIVGLVETGAMEEEQLFISIENAQALSGKSSAISRLLVSAVTVPLDSFGRRDPATMDNEELDLWLCTPYITSIALQLEQAIAGAKAMPAWNMQEAENNVAGAINALLPALALFVLFACAVAVAANFGARVMERRPEIALMRACGASRRRIGLLLSAELVITALAGGLMGVPLTVLLSFSLGRWIFDTAISVGPSVLPAVVGGSLIIAALGAIPPLARALRVDPAGELAGA